MIIFDTNKEKNALEEAKVLKIPIVAIIDSNSNPDGIDFLYQVMMMPQGH